MDTASSLLHILSQLFAWNPIIAYYKNSLVRKLVSPGQPIYDLWKEQLLPTVQEFLGSDPLAQKGFSFSNFPDLVDVYCR